MVQKLMLNWFLNCIFQVLLLGINELTSIRNVEHLKRELRVSYSWLLNYFPLIILLHVQLYIASSYYYMYYLSWTEYQTLWSVQQEVCGSLKIYGLNLFTTFFLICPENIQSTAEGRSSFVDKCYGFHHTFCGIWNQLYSPKINIVLCWYMYICNKTTEEEQT